MAQKQIKFADLRAGESVTLKLREGESVIVGSVGEATARGGRRINLKNNRNSVVVYSDTNFRMFAERDDTIQEVLAEYPVGTIFTYTNKYGKTLKWVKSGADRATLVNDERPAYSLSISEGFTDQGDTSSRLVVEY